MSTSTALLDVLKAELKAAGITYAQLAARIGLSESSVKRMFSRRDMPLSRIDEICAVCKLRFDDLARRVADAAPQLNELSAEQERAVVSERKLLLVAICALSQWSFEQITERYALSNADCVRCLARLDRLGIIELKPHNRYRVKVAKAFRWRPGGPVQRYFREHVIGDYFSGRFDGPGEALLLVHGSINRAMLTNFHERIGRLAQDFSAQHVADQKLKPELREGVTMVLALREWEFAAFRDLQRKPIVA